MTKVTAILLAAALVAGLLLESRQMRAQGRSGATRQMCPCRRRALGNSLWSRLVQMHRAVWQEPLCPGGGVDRQADLCEEVRAAVEVSKGRGQCRCHRLRGLPSRQGVRQPNALCRAETIWSTSVEGKSPHDMRGLFSGCLHCRAVLLRSIVHGRCLSVGAKKKPQGAYLSGAGPRARRQEQLFGHDRLHESRRTRIELHHTGLRSQFRGSSDLRGAAGNARLPAADPATGLSR
mmetsp:Transcript_61371/g.155879  ORF Transcript_61371/g.155879 Transcript_61371/m.155879 type:complete len:234 (+) Transcript_61371:147-848(+)